MSCGNRLMIERASIVFAGTLEGSASSLSQRNESTDNIDSVLRVGVGQL